MKFQYLSLAAILALSTPVQSENKSLSGYQVDTQELCAGFPKVAVDTPQGTCMGIAGSIESGLLRPRRILSLGNNEFVITDMKGWAPNAGKVWLFNSQTQSLKTIFDKVDHAHGLALGPEGKVYVGTRTTIFRFLPTDPQGTKEIVINNLPLEGNHPLTHFIFDEIGNLIVNIGAPSDQCLDDRDKPQYPCPQSTGSDPEASLRKYTREENGTYPTYRVIAKGLRNSMALAIEPMTGQLFQGENSMDFKELETPKEEINLIADGNHYGWPYCYEDGKLNPKYKRTFLNRRIPNIDCSLYTSPIAHLPAHSAPLDMMFYQGDMFPELQGKLIVSLHGYRETGHRIVSLNLNENFLPLEESRSEIVSGWTTESGLTPKGSPVGMTVDEEGRIWFVEDKNKTIMVLAKGDSSQVNGNGEVTQISLTPSQKSVFADVQNRIFDKSCNSCHGQFDGESNAVVNSLIKDGLIKPGFGKESLLIQRIQGTEMGPRMPLGSSPVSDSDTKKLSEFIDSLR